MDNQIIQKVSTKSEITSEIETFAILDPDPDLIMSDTLNVLLETTEPTLNEPLVIKLLLPNDKSVPESVIEPSEIVTYPIFEKEAALISIYNSYIFD